MVRVFSFEVMPPDGRLGVRPAQGGQVKFFEDYLAEGWRPLHWEALPGNVPIYRVVMGMADASSSEYEKQFFASRGEILPHL